MTQSKMLEMRTKQVSLASSLKFWVSGQERGLVREIDSSDIELDLTRLYGLDDYLFRQLVNLLLPRIELHINSSLTIGVEPVDLAKFDVHSALVYDLSDSLTNQLDSRIRAPLWNDAAVDMRVFRRQLLVQFDAAIEVHMQEAVDES